MSCFFLCFLLREIFPGFRQQGLLSAFFVAGAEGHTVQFSDGVFRFTSLVLVDEILRIHGEFG